MSEQFRDFAAELGYELPQSIEPGRRFRFSTNGKRGDDAGWGLLFPDGLGGVLGDWRTGDQQIWQAKRDRPFSVEERRAWLEKIEREKKEAQEQREREANEAAARAKEIWNRCKPAAADHAYLKGKAVPAYGLRIYEGPELVVGGMNCAGALILPLRNPAGEVRSLEFIAQDGDKRFLPSGDYKGCYYAIGHPGDIIAITEGFATGATIYKTSGVPVRIAATAGNLDAVAAAIREKAPDAKVIIAADNDRFTVCQRHKAEGVKEAVSPLGDRPEWCKCNPGITAALSAARAISGSLTAPNLKGNGTDFNDLAVEQGAEAVKAQIEAARPVAVESASEIAAQAVADGWPQPQPLPDQLPPVLPFSAELLPEEVRGWIADVADRIQCPIEFPAVACIVALGSVIGRSIAVRPKEKDDWEEFANLWGVIIGKPGVLKTPALQEALRPLRALEAKALEDHGAELASWHAGREAKKIRVSAAKQKAIQAAKGNKDFDASALVMDEAEDEPQARRYVVNDSSVEKLHLILKSSPNGVLAYRDELIGLLKSLDREGMESARAFYLSAYSGKEAHTSDRIGRGTDRVEHCCVAMLGSIQPSIIGRYLREAFDNGGDDGLLSRFSLLVWPDVNGEWKNVDRWPDSDSRKQANALFERMNDVDPQAVGAQLEEGRAPFLRLDADALIRFVEWREDFEKKQRDSEEHPALVAHFAKYRKLVPALALIFHLASRGTGPIGEAALLRALAWAEVLESHARRAYASIQQSRMESARALLAKIRAGDVANPIQLRDVYLKGWSGLSTPDDVRRAADLLEELDYLRSEVQQTPGRSKTVYWINPRGRA